MRWRTRSGVTCGCMSWSRPWPSWHDKHSGVLIGSSVTWLFDWTRACNYTRRARELWPFALSYYIYGDTELSWVTCFTQNAAFHIVFYYFTNYRPHLCGGGLYKGLMKLKLTRPQITWRWRKSPSYSVTNLLPFILLWNTRKIISSLHK